MSTLIKAKTQTLVTTGEILSDASGRKMYLRGMHNNKLLVVSMDERKVHMTAKPEQFGCFLVGDK
jgi:hypothetical protein